MVCISVTVPFSSARCERHACRVEMLSPLPSIRIQRASFAREGAAPSHLDGA
jgi:hypothetical protein